MSKKQEQEKKPSLRERFEQVNTRYSTEPSPRHVGLYMYPETTAAFNGFCDGVKSQEKLMEVVELRNAALEVKIKELNAQLDAAKATPMLGVGFENSKDRAELAKQILAWMIVNLQAPAYAAELKEQALFAGVTLTQWMARVAYCQADDLIAELQKGKLTEKVDLP